MIRHPKPGDRVWANYKYKFLPYQGEIGTVLKFINHGRGPKNVIVRFDGISQSVIVPYGNLNRYDATKPLPHYAKRI